MTSAQVQSLQAKVDELTDSNDALRLEVGRRAQEHQSQHAVLLSLQQKLGDMEARLGSQRVYGGTASASNEVQKRLDTRLTRTPFY